MLKKDIERNEETKSDAQVLGICGILRDAIEQPRANVLEYLQQLIPAETLFVDECLANHSISNVVRHIIEKSGADIIRDRNIKIRVKVVRALYSNPDCVTEAGRTIEPYHRPKHSRCHDPGPNSGHSTGVHTAHLIVATHGEGNGQQAPGRNKTAVANTFKEEDKYSGSFSGKVPLHHVRNKFLDVVHDQAIPRSNHVDLLHAVL